MSLIPSTVAVILLIIAFMFFAGCTTESTLQSQTVNQSPSPDSLKMDKSLFFYGSKIPQIDSIHPDYVKLNSDIYAQGETIEFSVVNEGSGTLSCWRKSPSYTLYRQIGTWELLTKHGGIQYDYGYYLKPGESTSIERLDTADLIPGHYKIVTECGVSREFEIHAAPVTTTKNSP